MKTLHLGIIMIMISCMTLCFTISPASALYSHGTLDLEKISDPTITQLKFNNSIITFEQHVNKTTYTVGETIYIYGQLRNAGTHDVYVSYIGPTTSSELKDHNGNFVDSFGGAHALDSGPYGNETLHPNTSTPLRVFDFQRNIVGGGVGSIQVQPAKLAADSPGIYYIRSVTDFNYGSDITMEHQQAITLWSEPLQIIVLPENQTLNQNLTHEINLWTYDPPSSPGPVAISSNGSLVAIGTRQDDAHGSVYLLDKNGFVLWSHDLSGMVQSLNMSSDGQFLEARTIQIQNNGGRDFGYNEWDANPDLYIFDMKGQVIFHNSNLLPTSRPVSLSQDQSVVVSANDSVISYGGTEKTFWKYNTKNKLVSVAVSPNGLFTAACTNTGLFYLDKQGTLLWTQKTDNQSICPVASSDLGYVLTGSALSNHTGILYLFDKNGNLLWKHSDTPTYLSSDGLTVSSDGKHKVMITGQSERNYGLSVAYYEIESIPEFSFAAPVMLIGLVSVIAFYGVKFRK